MNDKTLETMQSFQELEAYVQEVRDLYNNGHEYNSVDLYNAAADTVAQANAFLTKLVDLDDNLNLETTNLPNIDDLFEGSPVTDYLNSRIAFALGDRSTENIQSMADAAEAINEMTVYEDEDEDEHEECSCGEAGMSLVDYVTAVDESMTEEINYIMDEIDEKFISTDHFEGDDVKLLRYYLSHLPLNTKADIDLLPDRAVVLAYKQRQLAQGKI